MREKKPIGSSVPPDPRKNLPELKCKTFVRFEYFAHASPRRREFAARTTYLTSESDMLMGSG